MLTPSSLIVAAVYIPSQNPIDPKTLIKLTTLDPTTQFLIGGDFNARHVLWNNKRNNLNSKTIKEFIDKHPVNIIFPSSPTFLRSKCASIIDIFLTNITVLTKCYTKNDLSSSYKQVIFEIDSANPISLLRKYHSTDWNIFKQKPSTYTINNNITSSSEVESEIARFNAHINYSYFKSTCFTHRHNRTFPYIPEVQMLIRKRNVATCNFQRTNNPYYRLLRNMLSQKIHNLLNEVKITKWNKHLSKLKIQDHSFWNH